MLRETLLYPVRGPNTEAVFLKGYALLLVGAIAQQFPFPVSAAAVLPWFVVLGYYGRAFESTLDGADHPPDYDGLGALFGRAATVFAVTVTYLLPSAAYGAFLAGSGLFRAEVNAGAPALSPVATLLGTVLVLIVVASVYVLPAAIATAFEASSVRAALAIRSVIGRAFSRSYSVGVALAFVVAVLAGLLSRGIAALVPLGALVGLALTYFLHLVAVRLLGRGVAESPGLQANV